MPRYRDEYDPDDDIDRDPDEDYRRRVDRYGPDTTEEEEEELEKETEEQSDAARKRCLWPGLLMTLAAPLTMLGLAGFIVLLVVGPGATGGAGAVLGVMGLVVCGGLPLLFALAFGVFQLIGGICLMRRRGRGGAMAGAILGGLAVIPVGVVCQMANWPATAWLALGPALVGIPAGIWAFVAVMDSDVQDEFERNKKNG